MDREPFTLRIAGVDPTDPERIYVWQDRHETGGRDPQPDSLWLS